jgi:succinate dehydrogenase / fumarate reductase cytochrome b subunit
VLNFRFGLIPGLNELSVADHPNQAFDIVSREFRNVAIFVVYLVGITSTVWHLANGLWLFAVDWGIVIGERAQRMAGYACIGFGLLLLLVGINAQVAFVREGGLLGLIGLA